MAELDDLSTTDASNTARFPENMQFREVNDSARKLEGLLAREYKDRNMSLTSTGSANAFSVTPNRTISALADGVVIGFTANHSITGAATLNLSGLGAKPIVAHNGDALQSGDIVSGQKLLVAYRAATADFQIVGDRASGTSSDVLARVLPVGAAVPWPSNTLPAGYLWANGAAVSRTTYAELFAVYGTTYGVGDGSTTFNLPNYKGRSLFGKDDMGGTSAAGLLSSTYGPDGATLGATGGAESVTLSSAQSGQKAISAAPVTVTDPGHSHTERVGSAGSGGALAVGSTTSAVINATTLNTTSSDTTGITAALTLAGSAAASAHSNMPPAIIQNWIILALPAAASAATLGVNGMLYKWSTGTTDTNPGSGKLAFNDATLSSATELYISETDAAGAGMGPVLALWDDSTSTTKGVLYVYKVGALSTFAVFTISGSMTDSGAYDKFTVTPVTSGGTFAADDQLAVLFVPKGDKGDSAVLATDTTWAAKGDLAVGTGNDTATILPVGTNGYILTADSAEASGVKWAAAGAGSGDVTAASAFATDNRLIRSDGTGKGVQASGVTVDDSDNVTGIAALGAASATISSAIELGHASDTTLARSGAGDITIEGNAVYRAGGTDVALADGGTGASLTDPNADRLMFWDDSAGAVTWLTAGTGLTITGTTIEATGGGSGDVVGPASATDNAIARFDGTTGKLIQDNTQVTIDDAGAITQTIGTITASTPSTFSQTFNNAAVAFVGWSFDMTDTASATGSESFRVRAGATTVIGVTKSAGQWNANITAFVFTSTALQLSNARDIQFNGSAVGRVFWNSDLYLSRSAAATLQLGAADAASPVAQTFRAQGSRGGTDSNVGGGNLTLQSGTGTGTGTISTLILRSPVEAASGSTAQTQTTGLTICNGTARLASYAVAGVPSASTSGAGAMIYVSDESGGAVVAFSDGTDWRRVTDRAVIS